MQEKRRLVPIQVNWKASAYGIYIDGSEQSTLIARTIVTFFDGSQKTLRIIFEPFAECRYFNYNFGESNYNEYMIQSPDGVFRVDTADWGPYESITWLEGVCINPYFYEVQNSDWFNEKWYQKLAKQNFKHFLLVGYDSYLEVLAKDVVKYQVDDL